MKSVKKRIVVIILLGVMLLTMTGSVLAAHNKVPGPGTCYYGYSVISKVYIGIANVRSCLSHSECNIYDKKYNAVYLCSSSSCNSTYTGDYLEKNFHTNG